MVSPKWLLAFVLLSVSIANSQAMSDEEEKDLEDRILTPEQRQIVADYQQIAKLNFGDKCNVELEAKGNRLRESVKPYTKKLFVSAFRQGLQGKTASEFELSKSTEESRDEALAEIQEFTQKVQRSGYGGVCNDTKTLYCNEEVGQCMCGKSKNPKGFTFTEVDGHCKFELGSGCIQSEFSGLTDTLDCKKGSSCVTAIQNDPCTLTNSVLEGIKNPTRFQKIKEQLGYLCFCDKDNNA